GMWRCWPARRRTSTTAGRGSVGPPAAAGVAGTRGASDREHHLQFGGVMMEKHQVVSRDEWIAACKQLLAKEKEFTRLRDRLSEQRRALPWERVEKNYVFEGPNGKESLAQLFEGRSQLIGYHFMYPPDGE